MWRRLIGRYDRNGAIRQSNQWPITNFNDLAAFAMVAKERSFTKAGAKLGVSQSALSQTIKGLEERLKLRLLTRTTRSVAPTEAGIRLLETIAPRFEEIEAELAALGELRGKPAGTIRITAGEHPAITILQPALRRFLPDHPDIKVEIIVDYGLTDIVASWLRRRRAPRRAGRKGHDRCTGSALTCAWPWSARRPISSGTAVPASPQDLTAHNCIVIAAADLWRAVPLGPREGWPQVKVRGEGQLVFNNLALRMQSALDGLGLAYLPEDQVLPHIRKGKLVRVLEDWCPPFPGYHLYYPSRRHFSPALSVLVDVLRYRG